MYLLYLFLILPELLLLTIYFQLLLLLILLLPLQLLIRLLILPLISLHIAQPTSVSLGLTSIGLRKNSLAQFVLVHFFLHMRFRFRFRPAI